MICEVLHFKFLILTLLFLLRVRYHAIISQLLPSNSGRHMLAPFLMPLIFLSAPLLLHTAFSLLILTALSCYHHNLHGLLLTVAVLTLDHLSNLVWRGMGTVCVRAHVISIRLEFHLAVLVWEEMLLLVVLLILFMLRCSWATARLFIFMCIAY